jgi:hypothetical protein
LDFDSAELFAKAELTSRTPETRRSPSIRESSSSCPLPLPRTSSASSSSAELGRTTMRHHEQGRSQRDEGVGPHACGPLQPLALEAHQPIQDGRHQEAQDQFLRRAGRCRSGRGGGLGQPLAEDLSLTRGIVAEEAPRADLQPDRVPVPGQVRDGADVAALDPRRDRARLPCFPLTSKQRSSVNPQIPKSTEAVYPEW